MSTTITHPTMLRHPDRYYRNFLHVKPELLEAMHRCFHHDGATDQDRLLVELWLVFARGEQAPADDTPQQSTPEPEAARLDTPLVDLCLSVRAFNALTKAGMVSLGDLMKCSDADLQKIRGIGNAKARSMTWTELNKLRACTAIQMRAQESGADD